MSWCSQQFLLSELYILSWLFRPYQERKRKQVEINSGVSVVRKHELVLHCQSFLEVILYNTKAVVHFLLPDFFSCVCVCNIVQYLVLGEEIIFNFDNLIFLVISIRSWVLCLLGACLYLEKRRSPKEGFSLDPPAPFSHTQLSFRQQWPKSWKIINLIG